MFDVKGRKNSLLRVRLPDQEYTYLKQFAKWAGQDVSDFVRDAIRARIDLLGQQALVPQAPQSVVGATAAPPKKQTRTYSLPCPEGEAERKMQDESPLTPEIEARFLQLARERAAREAKRRGTARPANSSTAADVYLDDQEEDGEVWEEDEDG